MKRQGSYLRIDPGAARRLIETRTPLILDVRDAGSYASDHIPGAVNVRDGDVYSLLSSQPKQRPVLIYCYHGNASQTFAQMFCDFGFAEVFSLDGGFEHWRDSSAGR